MTSSHWGPAGWRDGEILDICLVTRYGNFSSRLADGLAEQDDRFAVLDAE